MPDAQSDSGDSELQKRWNAVLGMVEVQIDNQADFNAYLADSFATSFDDGVPESDRPKRIRGGVDTSARHAKHSPLCRSSLWPRDYDRNRYHGFYL